LYLRKEVQIRQVTCFVVGVEEYYFPSIAVAVAVVAAVVAVVAAALAERFELKGGCRSELEEGGTVVECSSD
jgi:hypothetical protein